MFSRQLSVRCSWQMSVSSSHFLPDGRETHGCSRKHPCSFNSQLLCEWLTGFWPPGKPSHMQSVETPPNKHHRASGVFSKGQPGTGGGSALDANSSGHWRQRQQEQWWCSLGIQPGLVIKSGQQVGLLLILNRPCKAPWKRQITESRFQKATCVAASERCQASFFCLVSLATAASSQDPVKQQMETEDPFMRPNDEFLMIN